MWRREEYIGADAIGCKKEIWHEFLIHKHNHDCRLAQGMSETHVLPLSHTQTHLEWFPPRLLVLHSRTHVICMPPLRRTDRTAFGNSHLLITSSLCSLLFPDRCPATHTHTRIHARKGTHRLTHNSILYTNILKIIGLK